MFVKVRPIHHRRRLIAHPAQEQRTAAAMQGIGEPLDGKGSLPAGAHVVRVESPGHASWRSRVEIVAGQAKHLSVSLEPEAP